MDNATPETDAIEVGWDGVNSKPIFAFARSLERRLAEAQERNRLLLDSDSEVFTERTHVADIQHDLQDANEDIACYIEREAQHKVALAALQCAHDKALARVIVLEMALEPFAETGRDLTNLICHVRLCQADVCSRCSLVLAARTALLEKPDET